MNGGDSNHQPQQQNQIHHPQQHPYPHNPWMAAQYHQQQWLAMQQYHPAAMMYRPHYVPYYPQFQPHQTMTFQQHTRKNQGGFGGGGGDDGDNRTIWIGDLKEGMDEDYLKSCFEQAGEVVSVKIIRNKHTGLSERYGFIEFDSHSTADKVLQTHNGTTMPNADQQFRLNWASFGSNDKRPEPATAAAGSDMSIFVGDLANDVTDAMLLDLFLNRYPSVRGAKVVIDSNSGRPKGYGFVRFGDENELSRAMNEMNGEYCSSRPMRIGAATPKKMSMQQHFSLPVISGGHANGSIQGPPDNDMSNTTIFVGGLDYDVTDAELKESFVPFGDVVSVKIPAGKGCGFVQFSSRSSAEEALDKLNGTVIGKQTVRLSWGRNPSRGDHYNGGQAYNGNGYFSENQQ